MIKLDIIFKKGDSPENSLAMDLGRMILAALMMSSMVTLPLCLMFFTFFRSRGGSFSALITSAAADGTTVTCTTQNHQFWAFFGNFHGNFSGRSGGGPTNQSDFYANQSGGGGYDGQSRAGVGGCYRNWSLQAPPHLFYLAFRIQCHLISVWKNNYCYLKILMTYGIPSTLALYYRN
jgi:hypothetical protein